MSAAVTTANAVALEFEGVSHWYGDVLEGLQATR